MKKIFLLVLMGISMTGFSQSDFLKNYKSPDFKYRTFNIGLLGTGNGGAGSNPSSEFTNSLVNLDLELYQRMNSQKYQGTANFSLDNAFSYRGQSNSSRVQYNGVFRSTTLNRIFFKNKKWFVGLHDSPLLQYHFRNTSNADKINRYSVQANPTFSIGKGRVEPVRYARNAMDIDYLLSKSGVLKTRLDEQQLTELSNRIAVIQNKRFFDSRKARIYQLQSMDSVMQELGLPIERNAVYFSDLQDAYLYGRVNERLSGLRHEFGLSQGLALLSSSVGNNSLNAFDWMTRGFYNFSYYLPRSYKTQHEIKTTVVGGVNDQDWGAWLATRYAFGFYPNTRTGMSVGVFANGAYFNDTPGFYTGVDYDIYYFISPRLRLSGGFSVGIANDYVPHGMHLIQRDNFNLNQNKVQYQYNFGLRYSIF